ncbi:hypothetical protein VSO92_08070 [Myroides pelagicus]|uniref:hypothetical protein n=1 Tax=Myroides pelagicus TaxID=270914 RepID=UPI002DB84421|nr:hypothetical protein [Myroides pelagicus]MEC4114060.1 hypothetical protein [Myroides pelagicus]
MEDQLVHNEGLSGHDITIILIIICIVGLQVYVFYKTYLKINLFKAILPKSNSFKTVKIYVGEDEITQVTIEEINSNLERYKHSNLDDRLWQERDNHVDGLSKVDDSQSQIRERGQSVGVDPIGKILHGLPDSKGGLKKEEDKEKSIYTIECKEDCTFYISIDGKYLGTAIFEIEDYIDFACEYDVPPNSSTKGIKVKQHGVVEKDGDGWRIIKKCKIEFV